MVLIAKTVYTVKWNYKKINLKIQRPPSGKMKRSFTPGELRQTDFSKSVYHCNEYRYLLLIADTFSGWPEIFPCQSSMAREVIKILLKEIILRFGNTRRQKIFRQRTSFHSRNSKEVPRFLEIMWNLYIPQRLQFSGDIEKMNQAMKMQHRILCQEVQKKWIKLY